jgi:hypothetical protein
MKRWLLLGAWLALLIAPVAAETPDTAKSAFPKFCEEWMEKLEAREKRNVTLIKWEEQADAVWGTYVGYSKQHNCILKDGDPTVPVGKITYLEVRYEKRGTTREEADRNPAKPLETTEETEIFRFAKGAWIY